MSPFGKWIQIFRAGNYGEKGNYSEQDLNQLASDYDPAKHEAPVVIGHPEMNAPAYGWVESLKQIGSTLLAKFRQIVPAFEELVRAGRYKKRSISLTRNPDGKLQLHHVGFLGAHPPEIKGLADIAFSAREGGATIEFGGTADSPEEALRKQFKINTTPYCEIDSASLALMQEAQSRASEMQISYGEALRQVMELKAAATVRSGSNADTASIVTMHKADALARQKQISFGEALRELIARENLAINESPHVKADPESLSLMREADKRTRKNVTFGEALDQVVALSPRINAAPALGIDADSLALMREAQTRASERRISYGEALRQINSERAT